MLVYCTSNSKAAGFGDGALLIASVVEMNSYVQHQNEGKEKSSLEQIWKNNSFVRE
jgi:hypothetical protein